MIYKSLNYKRCLLVLLALLAFTLLQNKTLAQEIAPAPENLNIQAQTETEALSEKTQEKTNQAKQQKDPEPQIPSPAFDSPPFPFSEHLLGGTSSIGIPDTSNYNYLLMKTLSKTRFGDYLKKHRIKVYGWGNVGGNVSSSSHSNLPTTYPTFSNRVDLDQVAINIERIPDTVQREHLDWGFRLTNFYGTDYRFTTAKGIFSDQLLKKNRQYGYDPILYYFDLYAPKIGKGTNFRIGRFLSVPDIEAQLAPDNYTYTHSLLYSYDIYTQQGVVATTKLNNQWDLQAGLTAGNDIAFWKREAQPTGLAGVRWTSKNKKDSLYLVANSINNGHFNYNNIQQYNATWSHKFNDRVHTHTEALYMWMKDVPKDKLPVGGQCSGSKCFTNEWAVVNYLLFKLSKKNFLTLRNEFVNDMQGQRTGTATSYSSHTIGLTHWFTDWLGFRPEFRYERSYDAPAYNNGTRQNQFLFASDLIVRF